MTRGPAEIAALARAMRDRSGNLEPLPDIYPDYPAPIVRTGQDGERELVMARWGMPSPAFALKGKAVDRGVTNVRNLASPHWRRWLVHEHRCLVPVTEFSEPHPETKRPVWFDCGGLAFFAGVWTSWTGTRKAKEGEIKTDLFAFLTCEPNAEVRPIHPKAMPVLLLSEQDREDWLGGRPAIEMQRPAPDGVLRLVP